MAATPEYLRQWRARNPDKCAGYKAKAKAAGNGKRYYAENREREIERAKEWAKKNPEKAKANVRASYARKREARLAEAAIRYRKNHEVNLKRDRAYRAARREERAAATRAWRRANPATARQVDANKKALRKGAIGCFSKADIERLKVAQRNRCAWCAASLAGGFHIDHIKPIARGGTNWPANIQLLCAPCNQRKHASDPIDFARREGRLL